MTVDEAIVELRTCMACDPYRRISVACFSESLGVVLAALTEASAALCDEAVCKQVIQEQQIEIEWLKNAALCDEAVYKAEIERLQNKISRLEPKPGYCEHGILDGDWCEPCNKAYKEAAESAENDT